MATNHIVTGRATESDVPECRQSLFFLDGFGWVEMPVREARVEGDWDEGPAGNRPAVKRILHSPRSRHYRLLA
jgi:hypothetical protein